MDFDTSLSLELVLVVLAILAAVWRLENKFEKRISALEVDFKTQHKELREEMLAGNAKLREEMLAGNARLREEFKADSSQQRAEFRADHAELRQDLRRVENKVDESNQRLARLEGIILAREDMVGTIVDAPE